MAISYDKKRGAMWKRKRGESKRRLNSMCGVVSGQSVENLMGKFSSDKIAFREFVGLLGRYESCIRVGSGARYRRSLLTQYPWDWEKFY